MRKRSFAVLVTGSVSYTSEVAPPSTLSPEYKRPPNALPEKPTAETLADQDPPLLSTTIGQRIVFADVVQTGRLAAEQDQDCPGAREIAAFAAEVARIGA